MSYCNTGSDVDLIELARELFVSAIELTDDPTIPQEDLSAIRDRIHAGGFEIVSLHVPVLVTPKTGRARDLNLEQGLNGLKRAALLGSPRVVLYARASPPGHPVEQIRRGFDEMLAQLVPEAVRMGLQPTFNNSGNDPEPFGETEYLSRLCRHFSPQAAMTFDPANCVLAGEDPVVATGQLAPWLAVVHMKDWVAQPNRTAAASRAQAMSAWLERRVMGSFAKDAVRAVARKLGLRRYIPHLFRGPDGTRYSGTMIGDGFVDHEALLRCLRQSGYTGYLSIEYEGTGDLASAYRQGVDRVRSILSTL